MVREVLDLAVVVVMVEVVMVVSKEVLQVVRAVKDATVEVAI